MLTQEQANQLNIQQHALEAAQVWYNQTQEKINRYDAMLWEIRDNYSSYSPEQKARISSLMWEISAEYQALKKQRQDYSLAQYEAQQQIWYYNQLNAQQPAPQGGQRRRVINTGPTPEIIVPETTIVPEPIIETPVKWQFWGEGWINNNWTLISPDWGTRVYQDWSISFWEVNTAPSNYGYYDMYAQMKWTWTPSVDIAKRFRWNLWQANSHNAYLVRQDLAKKWYTQEQINDFVQDWWNATLTPISQQYRLDSPTRIRTWWNENTWKVRTWGNGVPTLNGY